jgi:beta-hydroxylase
MSNAELKRSIRFLWVYRLGIVCLRGFIRLYNATIRALSHDPTYFDPYDFPWVKDLEAAYPDLREECLRIISDLNAVPNLDEISEGSTKLAQGGDWKGYLLVAFGRVAERNAARCPKTIAAVRRIPHLNTVALSVLGPGVHLPRHTGEFAGILRYHMGLVIPPGPDCRIAVDDEIRTWEPGKSLLFDDTHPHEVWNDTDQVRVVLFLDFVRPTFLPLMLLNRLLLWLVGMTSYTQDVIRNAEDYSARRLADAGRPAGG